MALNEEQQTEAVFKSVRTDVDPVSGNDVPPGSLPEEVRDDIPAMLSEGEYVVPADVLRYYGMKFFEDLRAEAKMGLAGMEANGRIGGEPVMDDDLPFSDEELMAMDMPDTEEVAAAEGGLMGFQEGGLNFPSYIKQPDLSFMGGTGGGSGLEYRTYVNEAGMTITIPFFDGEPMGMIPPGYAPEGETAAKEEDGTGGVSETGQDMGGPEFSRDTGDTEPSVAVEDMNATQVADAFSKTFDPESLGAKAAPTVAGLLAGPIAALAARGVNALNSNQRDALQSQAEELGLDLSTISDPNQDLSRDNFKSDAFFSQAMESVAPPNMSYNEETGGYEATGSTAPTSSPTPSSIPGHPSNQGTESESTGLQGIADSISNAVSAVADALGISGNSDSSNDGNSGTSGSTSGAETGADPTR